MKNLQGVVETNFRSFGLDLAIDSISFSKGLLQERLFPTKKMAFAHIDVDWFDPVLVSLKRIFPYLSVGGCIIVADYFDWEGCRAATDKFLAENPGVFQLDSSSGSLKITKTRDW